MGEYADMALDDAIHDWCFNELENPNDWDFFSSFPRRGPRPKSCQYCGTPHLYWKQTEGGNWRLHDLDLENNEWFVHTCRYKDKLHGRRT